MSDEDSDKENSPEQVVKPKRQRSKKPRPLLSGPGVVPSGKRFVCSYSGELTERAIFIPGVNSACFLNVPCAVAYIEDNAKSAEAQATLLQDLADAYGQTLGNLVRAPQNRLLANFGGDLFYEDWIGDLVKWDALTMLHGTTVEEFKNRGKKATKRGKRGNNSVTFEAATYSISAGKGAGGCRVVNTLEDNIEAGKKGQLTSVGALRKLEKFVRGSRNKEEGEAALENYLIEATRTSTAVILACVARQGTVPDEKKRNAIASALCEREVYGPALAIFTRKTAQKL